MRAQRRRAEAGKDSTVLRVALPLRPRLYILCKQIACGFVLLEPPLRGADFPRDLFPHPLVECVESGPPLVRHKLALMWRRVGPLYEGGVEHVGPAHVFFFDGGGC